MIPELGIVVRPLLKSVSRSDLSRLSEAQQAGATTFWTSLPIGVDLYTYKANRVNAYYILLVSDDELIGYLLLTKNKIDSGFGVLAGWTVAHTYLVPKMQKIGILRRIYDLILTKGRLISSSVQTPQGAVMWIKRIKTDSRNVYLLFRGIGDTKTITLVNSHSVNNLRDSIWDNDPNTLLLCAPKTDVKVKKVLLRYAKKSGS